MMAPSTALGGQFGQQAVSTRANFDFSLPKLAGVLPDMPAPDSTLLVESAEEAWRLARELQESLSWNITAPLRWVENLVGGVRWVRHAKSGESSD